MNTDSYDEYPSSPYGSSSYPNNFNYADMLARDDGVPRILLMGPRRSGKSSIQKVVFHKMSPHETLFLESTNDVRCRDISNNALVNFRILDFPGNFDNKDKSLDEAALFKYCGALVFVIDGQDDDTYPDAIDYFVNLAKKAYAVNPKIHYDVLIHKVDGDSYLSDDQKIDCQNEIQNQVADELTDNKLPIHPAFYLTSIYDHTIFEAFSKIVQRLIPQLAFLENLLDSLIMSCGIEKCFLFDVVSKIYVATDSNPVDMQTYELCSDMIDVVIDVSQIYGLAADSDSAYDNNSTSIIQLTNNTVLYLREVSKSLALVCLMRSDSFAKTGVVEYNVGTFRNGIAHLLNKDEPAPLASAKAALLEDDSKQQ